jgi:putative DNA primase/helicase
VSAVNKVNASTGVYRMVDYALAYSRMNWPVIPLHWITETGVCSCGNTTCRNPGKHPKIKGWRSLGTTDARQIEKWWKMWPDANIGILTGNASGMLVLDVDPRNGGDRELRKLMEMHGSLPSTLQVATGGGGLHYYFAMPNFVIKNLTGAAAFRPGLEIKSDGGYVVAPPSRHQSGKAYRWLINPRQAGLAEIPHWLAQLLQEAMVRMERSRSVPVTEHQGVIPEGERNVTLTRIAGSLRRRGLSEEEILEELRKINLQRCKPPLPNEEVAGIARSIARYAPGSTKPQEQTHPPQAPAFALTDLGNAERLVHRHGNDIRYDSKSKQWLVWDGKRWVKDGELLVRSKAYETVRSIYAEAEQCRDEKLRRELARHAKASESQHRIKAMVTLAQALPGIAVTTEQYDQDPWLLNVANGTIDLRTGELRPHKRSDYLTKLANVVYDPKAQCPTWERFLHRIMAGNERMIRYLQKAVGYSLTGDVSEQVIFFLHGHTGANGKSTFLSTIKHLLGDYAQGMQPETLMVKQHRSINNDIARLVGVRFVAAVEGDEGGRLSEALVKQMTGGDTITARFLYHEAFDFQPTHKIWFSTNHQPLIRGTDDAIWRRIRLIPFEVLIPEAERDPHLAEKLRAEFSGILRWAVEGCLLWQREGLGMPPEVQAATNEYRTDMDAVGRFLAECCIERPDAKVAAASLYAAYTQWCEQTGERPLSQRMLGRKLAERGYQPIRTSAVRMWQGIGLRDDAAPAQCQAAAQTGKVIPLRPAL